MDIMQQSNVLNGEKQDFKEPIYYIKMDKRKKSKQKLLSFSTTTNKI